MRKTIIALFALAAVGFVQPNPAFARGGGGGGHGGAGGGHGGGFGGGGFHGGGFGGGGFRSAAIGGGGLRSAAIGGFRSGAFAANGFRGGGFHHGFRRHGRGFASGAFALGLGYPYSYYDDYYPYYDYAYDDAYYGDGGCYVVQRRVHTRHGWRIRPVQVCG
jgi:hypothetical protein